MTENRKMIAQPVVPAAKPLNSSFSPRYAWGERGAEPVPLPAAPLRENQGHETDRFAAAQPRVRLKGRRQ